MRHCYRLDEEARLRSFGATLGAVVATATVFVAAIFLSPDFAQAADKSTATVGDLPAERKAPANKPAVTQNAPKALKSGTAARLNTPPASEHPAAPSAPSQQNGTGGNPGSCTCPADEDAAARARRWPKPSFADLTPHNSQQSPQRGALPSIQQIPQQQSEQKFPLDDNDAVAALEAMHLGLSEVADGATYVWHRGNGRLSGAIQPTKSFKASDGQICRHVIVSMSSGTMHRRTEGIACRAENGGWAMNG
jgi:surface antigen